MAAIVDVQHTSAESVHFQNRQDSLYLWTLVDTAIRERHF